jgi:hypothetical protein
MLISERLRTSEYVDSMDEVLHDYIEYDFSYLN